MPHTARSSPKRKLDDVDGSTPTPPVSNTQTNGDDAKKKKRKCKCPYDGCNVSRRKPGELQQHVDLVHKEIFHNVCDHIDEKTGAQCGYKCETPGSLRQHKREKHSDVRDHKCTDDPGLAALRDRTNQYMRALYASDETVRVKTALRGALWYMMKKMGMGKVSLSEKVVGCAYKVLVAHLNNNDRGFLYEQSVGLFHIDHIRPMASFKNLKCTIEVYKCMNFNNLQLLPGPENCRKCDSFTSAEEAAYAISKGGLAIAELEKGWRTDGVCKCELCIT
ncbi:hypothetical protein T484DRAFT_1756510 [Baffinella frigidus]|nr:hypothetical protein T484DRAFT_1756510 [Cryptophyta sp. CCMP2293]